MQSFIHTVIIFVSICFNFGHTDKQSRWNLRLSSPSRDGRFLSVPVYYGDWVPITKAKQTIEAVASRIEAATSPARRKDPPLEIITSPDLPEDRLVNHTQHTQWILNKIEKTFKGTFEG